MLVDAHTQGTIEDAVDNKIFPKLENKIATAKHEN